MSLFERIQNRRYDLQEAIDDKGNITPEPGDIAKEKSIVRNIKKKQRNINKKNVTSSSRVKATSDILKTGGGATSKQKDFAKKFDPKNLSKTLAKTTSDPKGETLVKGTPDEKLIRTTKPTGDEGSFRRNARRKITGDVIPKKDLPKTKGVNQADVSKKAKEFTKKVNKQRIVKQGNIFGGQDKVKPKTKVGSTTPRGTRTINKKFNTPGQQSLDLGGDITKKTPKTRLSKSGEIVTDLRTVKKKTKRTRKPVKTISQLKKEPMVTVKDPIKGGFRQVGATTKQGREVLKKKKFVSTDELLGNKKEIVKKTNLFSRVKGKLKDFHKFMVKDAGFRTTASKNLTKNTFKNTLRGNTLKNINKVLPGKYKALALAVAGTAIGVDQALKNRKAAASGVDTKKPVYKKAVKTLNLDTGKKNN